MDKLKNSEEYPHKPKVSVIIPNYNYERFLEDRINSILNQSYRDFEIIFLDDASTDDSVDLVNDRFGDCINQIVVNNKNSGNPFVQWNKGVRMATGEYVWIAEADDTCTPEFLGRLVGVMDSDSSVGLAYCNTTPINDDGTVLSEEYFHLYVSDLDPIRWKKDYFSTGLNEVKSYLSRKNSITNVSGVLFRRDVYMQAGLAPENMRMCGDWLTYCKILLISNVAYVAAPMNFHRQHPTKHTHNSVLNLTYFREFLQVQQYVEKALNQEQDVKREALRRFLGEWDRLTVSSYGRIDINRMFELKNMAERSYPGFRSRITITAHFILNSVKSLGAKWLKMVAKWLKN